MKKLIEIGRKVFSANSPTVIRQAQRPQDPQNVISAVHKKKLAYKGAKAPEGMRFLEVIVHTAANTHSNCSVVSKDLTRAEEKQVCDNLLFQICQKHNLVVP